MDLRRLLLSIRSISDLQLLVAGLGHRPAWDAVPAEAWNRPGRRSFALTAVGQTAAVPWFAVESRAPEREAVQLARRITGRGKAALVLALNPASRRLGVAVAFDRSPGIELDLAQPDPGALASLARLAGTGEQGTFAFLARAADALSTEPVSRRFFREFKATLDRMAAELSGRVPPHDRHAIVLLQLTRVLFLYFVQSKGWLDGRERFLALEIDRCLSGGRRIHRDFLRPLFFGILNQPPATRSRTAHQFGAIPFLNGGLFEPHPLERRYPSDLPNSLWQDAFERLFERFHFTVAEGGTGGSIAPDMLGRVFEGVMAPDVRHRSGTFYTPALLVDRVLDAALNVFLSSRLRCSEAEADRRLRDPDNEVVAALDSIRLLDPAVGSGAFLLGALNRLARSAAHKRRVLQHSLFGVDVNAAAVRLTELRLWLSIIADDPCERPERVHPLPNLDCLVRQGDSLFDPVGLEVAPGMDAAAGQFGAELSTLRREVIATAGPEKRSLVRRLRELEARLLSRCLEAAEVRQRSAIADCLRQGRALDLFGQRRGLDRELASRLAGLRLALRNVRQMQRRLAHDAEIPWFHYRSAFADVFARGGFDIVIGNPPWLRSEVIPVAVRQRLRGRYRWWHPGSGSYGNCPDLAVAFLERAFDLAAADGVVAMLVPAKIASAGYGAPARCALASGATLHVLANLTGAPEASFDATVYPLALIARKAAPPANHRVRTALTLEGSRLPQSELRGGGPWVLAQRGVEKVLVQLERDHPTFADVLACHLGVKTGLNQVFLNPPGDVEPDLLRWAVRGRDITAFRCRPRLRLLWTHDLQGAPAADVPPRARAYLEQHASALRGRRDYRSGPAWAVFRTRPALARYRVVWPDLARRLTAAALVTEKERALIPLNTCYLAGAPSAVRAQAAAAWLNSTWIRVIAALGAVPASGGFRRFNAQAVNRVPLPTSALLDPALAQLARAGRAGRQVQAALDAVAARHLGLSRPAQRLLRAAMDVGSVDHR